MKKKLLMGLMAVFLLASCGKSGVKGDNTEAELELDKTKTEYEAKLTEIAETEARLNEVISELEKNKESASTEAPTPDVTETLVPDNPKTLVPDDPKTLVPEVSETPVPEVTVTPTPEITVTPTPEATLTPTLKPTATPTFTPVPTKPVYTIKELNPVTMYASNGVNVRNAPNVGGKLVGSLEKGDAVTVTGQCTESGWYRILFGNGYAYVSNSFIIKNAPTPTPKPATATPKPTTATPKPATSTPKPSSGIATIKFAPSTIRNIELYKKAVEIYTNNKSKYNEALDLTNKIREKVGSKKLVLDESLCIAATMRAIEMNQVKELNDKHTRPDGSSFKTIYIEIGYLPKDYMQNGNDADWDSISVNPYAWGENIACGQDSVAEVIQAWENSKGEDGMSGHYGNMINPKYNKMGFGFCDDDNISFWAQEFFQVY